jgi:hypothetical protein
MNKLTTEQIGTVSNYIQSFDIKWYELQVELTDHFVSIMEEIWNEDPALTFHQVKQIAEQRFGRNYFKEVEKEKIKILGKEYNRSQRKMVTEYLKFPKIILSILMIFFVYKTFFYFDDFHKYIKVISTFFLIGSLFMLINWFRFRRIDGECFLAIEIVFGRISIATIFWNSLLNFTKDYAPNQYLLFAISFLWVLGFLFLITGIHIANKTVSNIKKQYQLS